MGYFAIIILIILILLVLPTAYASIIGAPIFLTSKSKIKDIIKKAEIRPGEAFYELGTGTGRVITAVAGNKDIKVVGFELSPIFYFITLINLKLHKRENYELCYKNFLKADFKNADVIYLFLMPKTLEKLKSKFSQELKPSARVVSYGFKIKEWKPYELLEEKGSPPVYFYKKQA